MAYRDENHALRARLDAAETRLRETESALAEANRRAEAAEAGAEIPEVAEAPIAEHGFVRTFAVGWAVIGIGFVAWQLLEAGSPHVGPVVATLAIGLLMFAAPSAIVLRLSTPRRRARQRRPNEPRGRARVRIAASGEERASAAEPARVEELDTPNEPAETPSRRRQLP